jgi:hypothetical protein
MRRAGRSRIALTAAAAVAAVLALSPSPAEASLEGPCRATIAGVDVEPLDTGATGDKIDVKEGDDVVVTMSGRLMTHLKLKIAFAGSEITIKDKDISAAAWSEAVPVDDYAKWGKGLYLVSGEATGQGGFSCKGAALVNVEGNPLSSLAGAVGLGMAILGVAGVGAAGAAAYRASARPKRTVEAWTADQLETLASADAAGAAPREDTQLDELNDAVRASTAGFVSCWALVLPALLLTTGAMIGGGGGAAEEPRPVAARTSLPRARWRPKLSLFGLLAGLVGGVGVGVLLQQYAVVYPTRSVAIIYIVVGLLTGLVIPSIGRWFGVRAVNRAVDDAERRLASARA